MDVEIIKTDPARRLAFGWAAVALDKNGDEVEDSQGDVYDVGDLEKAVYDFMSSGDSLTGGGLMHVETGIGPIIESVWFDADKLQKMGLPPGSLPTAWWIGVGPIREDVWKDVESGKLSMFSVGGTGVREVVPVR